ncbi:MAG: hypothetical protein H6644_03465 [Caldilineaceae bacterium]|nr:hypothetical protein [Caldilineaceae bacterium]
MQHHYLDDAQEKRVRPQPSVTSQRTPSCSIVTQKLLTGFDAPVAYAMCRTSRSGTTLLQAIAPSTVPARQGQRLDSGHIQRLQGPPACAGDRSDFDQGLIDLEVLKRALATLRTDRTNFSAEPQKVDGRTTPGRLFLGDRRQEAFFKEVRTLLEWPTVLSPDRSCDYIRPHGDVMDAYRTVSSYFASQDTTRRKQRELLEKTEQLIKEHVEVQYVAEPLPLYPINRNIADVIAKDEIPERVKVINLQRSITAYVDDNIERAPYLASISAEVEKVIEQLRQKQISAKTALEELEAKVSEMVQRREERESSTLDDLAFALSTSLRAAKPLSAQTPDDVDQLAQDVAGYLQAHTGWPHNDQLKAQVRLELYKRLLPRMQKPVNPQAASAIADDLLRMHRITL